MVTLYQDPNGEKVFTSHSLTSSFSRNKVTVSESPEETISGLHARIKELESILSFKEVSI